MSTHEKPPSFDDIVAQEVEEEIDRLIKAREDERIKEHDFAKPQGPYEAASIQNDLRKVADQELTWKKRIEAKPSYEQEAAARGRKNSGALEAIVARQGELANWFGPDILISNASTYDDYFNQADCYAEIGDADNLIVLALDITQHTHEEPVKKKFTRNVEKMRDLDNPPRLKYFESQVLKDATGRPLRAGAKNVIPLVIGLDGNNTEDLVRLYARSGKNKMGRELLDTHPLRLTLLDQIIAQLDFYAHDDRHRASLAPAREYFTKLRAESAEAEVPKDKTTESLYAAINDNLVPH